MVRRSGMTAEPGWDPRGNTETICWVHECHERRLGISRLCAMHQLVFIAETGSTMDLAKPLTQSEADVFNKWIGGLTHTLLAKQILKGE